MKEKILVLGATGSIGRQTLDILKYSFQYELVAVSLNTHIEVLEEYLFYFDSLKYVAISNTEKAKEFKRLHPSYIVITGKDCNEKLLEKNKDCTVFNSLIGNIGLLPSLKAIEQNQDLLLSNKESLVIGSSLIKQALKKSKSHLYPVDSEHVALNKILNELKRRNIKKKDIKELIVTASGGSLRDYSLDQIQKVTPEQVLKHPTWHMGNKITVDCATLVNKGYEVIEASVLFNFPLEKVNAIICRESLVHAKVIYYENSKEKELLEYSPVDMKVSIEFALSKGKTSIHKNNQEDKENINKLHFNKIDNEFYPLFSLTKKCFSLFGNEGMIYYNALDSLAISYFLNKKIPYLDIEKSLTYLVNHYSRKIKLTSSNLKEIENDANNVAKDILDNKLYLRGDKK